MYIGQVRVILIASRALLQQTPIAFDPLDITDEALVKAAAEAYSDVNLPINVAEVGFNQRLVTEVNFDKM